MLQQQSEILTDDELVTMTGGGSFPEMTQSVYILRPTVIKPKYGIIPFYGIMPLYGIKPTAELV